MKFDYVPRVCREGECRITAWASHKQPSGWVVSHRGQSERTFSVYGDLRDLLADPRIDSVMLDFAMSNIVRSWLSEEHREAPSDD